MFALFMVLLTTLFIFFFFFFFSSRRRHTRFDCDWSSDVCSSDLAGILEIADIFVVSKADKPGADQTVAELAMLLSLDPMRRMHDKTLPYWRIPVLKTAAIKGQGIPQVVDAMQQHYDYLVESGMLASRAQRQVRSEVEALVLHAVVNALKAKTTEDEWQQLVDDITKHERDPYSVAGELEERIGLTH